MNIIFKTLLLFIGLGSVSSVFAQEKEIEIQQYDIQLVYNADKNQLDVKLEIDVLRNTEKPAFAVLLNGSSIIKHINFDKQVAQFSQNPSNNTITIYIPKEYIKQKKSRVSFDYFIPLNKDFIQNDILFLSSENNWCPLLPSVNAGLKLSVTAPAGYQVLVQGSKSEAQKESSGMSTSHYQQTATDMSFPIMIGKQANKNSIVTEVGETKISFSFASIDSASVKKIMEITEKTFEFYQTFLGKYPFLQLNFIEIPGEDVRPRVQGNTIFFTKSFKNAVHNFEEITASQWWGDGVRFSPSSKGYCFLSSSIKDFFTLYQLFKDKPKEEFEAEISKLLDQYNSQNNPTEEKPLTDVFSMREENSQTVVHLKGVVVTYYMTVILGDDIWKDFFRDLYQSYNGKILTYEKFVEMVQNYDNVEGYLFNQINNWLTTTGTPAPPIVSESSPEEEEIQTESEDENEPIEIIIKGGDEDTE